jgi:phytoene dehydrogenase-like protein
MSLEVAIVHDGIIIGAGHNGLILQAYLCRAGLDVVSIDRREVSGGGLVTIENPRRPGFMHDTHAVFHRALNAMPWYRDLELKRLGAEYIEPELNVAMLLADGHALEWWTDLERTAESFARLSPTDAATLRRWHDDFVPIVGNILIPEANAPPLPPARRREILENSADGRSLLEISALSPLEFVRREFEHPAIQAGLLFFNGLREVDMRVKGFGHHIAFLLASPAKAQLCRGGAAQLARALDQAVIEARGIIRTSTVPKRIVIENGRATGVETTDGELIKANKFVASALDPHQTFLDLIEPDALPASWRSKAEAFEYNILAPLFALNLCLDEAPRYSAAGYRDEIDRAFMVIAGLDHVDQYDDIIRHHEAGTIPSTVMWGATPTLFDPAQAPAGKHTAFMWEKLPYALGGDATNWDAAKEAHGEDMLSAWSRYAPNLADAVIDRFVRSPLDVERDFPNMRRGDLLIGAFTNGQIGYHRPFPGAGQYRGHLKGLYLCGSSSHPGGNVTGLPGYNAAQVVLSDLGLETGWTPPSIESRLAAL